MANLTGQKPADGSPGTDIGEVASSNFGESAPIITAKQIRDEFLWGIPLVSPFPDPITKQHQVMSDAIITKNIHRAINIIENKGFAILPKVQTWKAPWDYLLFQRQQFMRLPGPYPISAVQELSIRLANQVDLFVWPLTWLDCDKLAYGIISLTPIGIGNFATGYAGSTQNGAGGGIWYLGNGLSGSSWAPSYFYCEYTSGASQSGVIPNIFNEAIGLQTSILILQQLQATRALVNSQGLGIDGLSQNFSGPGNRTYEPAIEKLEDQYLKVMNRLKSIYGLSWFASDVG